jgi:CO/xanthine dehydrogenase FAD-binding subunit
MKSFAYASPTTEGEALSLLAEPGEIEILAGGTDLVGLMKKMIITPDLVVNILDIPSLKTIEQLDGGAIAIGAAVTLDEILAHPYLDPYPAIGQAIQGISSMQLQCQGTLGFADCSGADCSECHGTRHRPHGTRGAVHCHRAALPRPAPRRGAGERPRPRAIPHAHHPAGSPQLRQRDL